MPDENQPPDESPMTLKMRGICLIAAFSRMFWISVIDNETWNARRHPEED
jgi:hypothetical protein